jgi:hypothetical protein
MELKSSQSSNMFQKRKMIGATPILLNDSSGEDDGDIGAQKETAVEKADKVPGPLSDWRPNLENIGGILGLDRFPQTLLP